MKNWTTPLAITALLAALLASPALAARTGCPEHFSNGEAPDLINGKLDTRTREVCYSGYALKHSGITRTPLYAAEHLTRERLKQGKGLKRRNSFHADANLPESERAELRHYARSGYDRGHVAPSADMFDPQSQYECFSLANMMPQIPESNRGPWEGIEANVRKMALERGDLYVVTGPIFRGERLQRIGGAVLVPTSMFKAVYDPRRQEAAAYLLDNSADSRPRIVSIAELEQITGISVFPGLSNRIKTSPMSLADAESYREKTRRRGI